MKIKHWLVGSYLLAMILPVVLLYFLIYLVQTYHQDQEMLDYLDTQAKLNLYEGLLSNSRLYRLIDNESEFNRLRDYSQNQTFFSLYDREGFLIFTTKSDSDMIYKQNQEQLFQNLYELRPTYYTFEYKSPVFDGNELVGFYEISFLRLDWLNGVEHRKSWSILLYIVSFLVIYLFILYMLQRKLFRPLKALMKQMSRFAKGETVQKLPRKKDEIGELIIHFEQMRMELEDKSKSLHVAHEQKQYMIASISHDLKTPLTAIRTSVEGLISKDSLIQEDQERIQTVIRKTDYIHQLIDDLTIYTILQSNQYEMETVLVEGQEFFEMLLSDYDLIALSFQVELYCSVNTKGYYYVNSKQMLRLSDNLMMNAFEHTESGNQIWACVFSTLETSPPFLFPGVKDLIRSKKPQKEGLWMIVQNEGEVIPIEDQEKLFDPLFQRDPSRNKDNKHGSRGSGLGLSIAKMIIERLGGFILVSSASEYGTAFICYLPEQTEVSE